jgi:serine/threonine-protein kinase
VDWLRADLGLWAEQLASGPAQTRPLVRLTLRRWQQDPDLAGLRDPAALTAPPAAEREACQALWADVAALLARAGR